VQSALKKHYKTEPNTTKLNVLEAVVRAICHENATMAQADQAFARFKSDFFDWNEVRVSSIEDLKAVFQGMSDDEGRAMRLRRFLRQLFDKTYGFNLDALTKKPLKDSVKVLQEYDVFHSDYILAEVSRLALGGHAIGIDACTLRVLDRLGVGPGDTDLPTYRGSLERAIPKNRGAEFVELIEELAADVCLDPEPNCPACELRKICPRALAPPPPKPSPQAKDASSASESAGKSKNSKGGAKSPPAKPGGADSPAPSAPAPAPAEPKSKGKSKPTAQDQKTTEPQPGKPDEDQTPDPQPAARDKAGKKESPTKGNKPSPPPAKPEKLEKLAESPKEKPAKPKPSKK
jgi:endonuclease-3